MSWLSIEELIRDIMFCYIGMSLIQCSQKWYNEQGQNFPGECCLSISRLYRAALQRVHNDNSTATAPQYQVNTTMKKSSSGRDCSLNSLPRLLHSWRDYMKRVKCAAIEKRCAGEVHETSHCARRSMAITEMS